MDHATCFTSQEFQTFRDLNDNNIICCTVSDHRSNGLVENLTHTIKTTLLTMSSEIPKPSLHEAL